MKLKTSRFGEVEIEESKTVTFPWGIPGFEEYTRFVFLHPDPEFPFSFMQALDDGDLCFVVTNPFLFYPDYEFELDEDVKRELEIERETDLIIYSIITVKEKVEEATANLLAPVIINADKNLGRQIVLHDSPYQTRHRLFVQMPAAMPSGREIGRQGSGHPGKGE